MIGTGYELVLLRFTFSVFLGRPACPTPTRYEKNRLRNHADSPEEVVYEHWPVRGSERGAGREERLRAAETNDRTILTGTQTAAKTSGMTMVRTTGISQI